jgi:hypothetical protein
MPRSQTERNAALRCIVYDTAVLAVALRELQSTASSSSSSSSSSASSTGSHDLGRGTDQLAVEAALIKYRSLFAFLSGANRRPDDIQLSDFGYPAVHFPQAMQDFCTSVNKYAAHLTWERVEKNPATAEFPRPSTVTRYGGQMLPIARAFIDHHLNAGHRLNRFGTAYLAKLRECMGR